MKWSQIKWHNSAGVHTDAMLKHLLENNLITPDQHGFTNGRFCLTNLLDIFASWTGDVDQGVTIDVNFF